MRRTIGPNSNVVNTNKSETDEENEQSIHSDQQTFKNKSLMSELNNALKLNPLKIVVVFCLIIIIYICACETIRFGYKYLNDMPKGHIDLYRFLQILWCIFVIFAGFMAIYSLIIFLGGLFLYLVDNFMPLCVSYWYIEGKPSCRWWQTKFAITYIIGSLIIILWIIFAVKLGQLLLFDFASNDMSKDRWIVYRITGLLIITLLSIVCFIGAVYKKDQSFSIVKRRNAQ